MFQRELGNAARGRLNELGRIPHSVTTGQIVSLQSVVGNAAVSRSIARQPIPDAPAAKPETATAATPQIDAGQMAAGTEQVVEQAIAKIGDDGADLPDNFIEEQLTAMFQEFAALEVVVRGAGEHPLEKPRTVKVHTPYFINVNEKSAALSKEVFAEAEEARGAKTVKKFFQQVGKAKAMGGWHALHGKSTPHHLQAILQAALDQGVIQPQNETNPTGGELEDWLRKHGVGVDCSGFVSQALNRVLERSFHGKGFHGPTKHIALGTGGLKGGAEGFAHVGKDKSCAGPRCLKPGDTMNITGHVRIIANISARDGGIEFSTFESGAGGKARVGLMHNFWFYPDAARFAGLQIKKDEEWKPSKEKPGFGRYGALDAVAGDED